MDIEPYKLTPTCKNNRCGKGRLAKILDHFLVTETIVDRHHFIRQWVGKGTLSDHYPIFLEFKNSHVKPPIPLKLKKIWLKDEGFRALISNRWIPFNPGNRSTATFKFAANIRNLKDVIKSWAVEKRKREDSELQQIEIELFGIYNMDGDGMMNQTKKDELI